MAPIYKEAQFPIAYREAEVQQIMNAIYRRRSIAVTGLAGMGKSNVVRFIVSHPQVRSHYLRERADSTTLLHIDCAGLAANDAAEILGEVAFQLARAGLAADASHTTPPALDLRRGLREQIAGLPPERTLALVFDYFDEAAASLDRSFFNYLFHLRNSRPQGNLCYVFATRRPLRQLYELQELLDDGCVVGPLCYRDALDSLRRDEERLGCHLEPDQQDRLIACTGGHPGLLKNAAELACTGSVDRDLAPAALAGPLLQSAKVRNLCEELWDDLTAAEQGAMLKVVQGARMPQGMDRATVRFLLASGLLAPAQDRDQPVVFCPLFASFVQGKASASGPARISAAAPNQARIQTAGDEKLVALSPRLFALLLALSERSGAVVPTGELIARVYGDEAAGVTDAALSQLVKRLRERLDSHARAMTGDPTYTCIETIRDVGYQFNG